MLQEIEVVAAHGDRGLTDAGQIQTLAVRRRAWQQFALHFPSDVHLALQHVPFPADVVGRLDLPAHPVVGAERHRDYRGEHRVGREDQQHGPELREREERLGHKDRQRTEAGARDHDQRIDRQTQPTRQPCQQRRNETGRGVRGVAHDHRGEPAQPKEGKKVGTRREHDPGRDGDADSEPGRRPTQQEAAARPLDRCGGAWRGARDVQHGDGKCLGGHERLVAPGMIMMSILASGQCAIPLQSTGHAEAILSRNPLGSPHTMGGARSEARLGRRRHVGLAVVEFVSRRAREVRGVSTCRLRLWRAGAHDGERIGWLPVLPTLRACAAPALKQCLAA